MKTWALHFDTATRRAAPAAGLRFTRGDALRVVCILYHNGTARQLDTGESLAMTVKVAGARSGPEVMSVDAADWTEGATAAEGYTVMPDTTLDSLESALGEELELRCEVELVLVDEDGEHTANPLQVTCDADLDRPTAPGPIAARSDSAWLRTRVTGNVCYLHTVEGDDATAIVGNRYHPFQTLAAALAACADANDDVQATMVLLNDGPHIQEGNSRNMVRLHFINEVHQWPGQTGGKVRINLHCSQMIVTGDGNVQLNFEFSGHTNSVAGVGGTGGPIRAWVEGFILRGQCIVNAIPAHSGAADPAQPGVDGYDAELRLIDCAAIAKTSTDEVFSLAILGSAGQAGGAETDPEADDAGNGGHAGKVRVECHGLRVLRGAANTPALIKLGYDGLGGASGGDGGAAGDPCAIEYARFSGVGGYITIQKEGDTTGTWEFTDLTGFPQSTVEGRALKVPLPGGGYGYVPLMATNPTT